jgi:hypothetical protein
VGAPCNVNLCIAGLLLGGSVLTHQIHLAR